MTLEPAKELPPHEAAALMIATQRDLLRSLERRLDAACQRMINLEAEIARLTIEAGK